MTDWQETPAEDFCNSVRDGTHDSPKPVEEGRYLITSRHIIGDRIDLSNAYQITQADFDEVNRRSKVDRWDVLITMIGTVGDVCLVREEPNFAIKNIGLFKTKGEVSGKWLYYYMKSPFARALLESLKRGTTQAYVPLGELRKFPIRYPEDQGLLEATVSLLSSFDDKIELNRRMNETLEAMARAVFKDWFVDFGPTRAKAAGRAPYLPPDLWSLFPDALDDEGKPVGWETYTLADLAHHHRATVSPSLEPEYVFEHYSIPAYDSGNEPTIDLGSSIKSNKTIVPEGAVLLSKLNPEIERVWLSNPKGEAPQVASTEFLAFTPLAPATRTVLFCLFKSKPFREEMAALVTGTSKSHQRVSPKALLSREVLDADPRLLTAFDDLIRSSADRLLANIHESRSLAQTRDLLLPKLMSGEIRLAEAEKAVEAVA